MLGSRMELRMGAPVVASDGGCGRLEQIVVDPPSRRATALVVRENPLAGAGVKVPVDEIVDATDEAVNLRLSRAQVATLPVFAGGISLRAGQMVRTYDGHTGLVVELLMSPSGEVHHLVVNIDPLRRRQVIVPVEAIARDQQLFLSLKIDGQALESLPVYRPDCDILEDLTTALWHDPVLREMEIPFMDVDVQDGIAILRGHTATAISKAKIAGIAASVSGVLGIDNSLVADPDLQIAVAQAIGQDPRVNRERIRVDVQHGIVTLSGAVSSLDARRIAGERAVSVSQVRGVLNYLSAPGAEAGESVLRVVEPCIGQEVFTGDGPAYARVIRVIINPRNRLVSGIVVRTQPAEPLTLFGEGAAGRKIVLPASLITLVSGGGIFLSISRSQMGLFDDFDETDYDALPEDWHLFPYSCNDVLLMRG